MVSMPQKNGKVYTKTVTIYNDTNISLIKAALTAIELLKPREKLIYT
jgi:hypothetical protein